MSKKSKIILQFARQAADTGRWTLITWKKLGKKLEVETRPISYDQLRGKGFRKSYGEIHTDKSL